MTTICLSSNTAWSLYNYRRGLIDALLGRDYRVVVLAPRDAFSERLAALGCEVVDLSMDRQGLRPHRDIALIGAYRRAYRRLAPNLSVNFTIKPVIYGGLAARRLGIGYASVITGLGAAFARDNWLRQLVETLYRRSQHGAARVFFLNAHDRQVFVDRKLAPAAAMEQLPGEGVDLARFAVQPWPEGDETRLLLLARMLWNKGVGEFVAAARRVKRRFPRSRFQLLGPFGVANPAAMRRAKVDRWVEEGLIEYLGDTDDVRPYIAQAHCVVLPSYYGEGLPRALLEAAAMGRPVITTDHVGCRDAVWEGRSGLLCEPRNVASLAESISRFLELDAAARQAMGLAGREHVERHFDERLVVDRYLALIDERLGLTSPSAP